MRYAAVLLLLATALPSRAADEWTRLATPNFELYTSAGEKAGKDAILYFEQVRSFFIKAAPVRFPAEFPVRIIVFKNREQFAEYAVHSIEVAYYASSSKRDYIVMSDASFESYAIAVHEYMHLIIRHSGLHIPVWLNEGLADVYSTLRPVRDGVAVGDLIPGRMQPLLAGKWLTFESLTSTDTKSAVYNEAERAGIFYGESWALAHMLFLAPDYRDNFGKFLMALHRGKTSAEACDIAFGKSAAQVFSDLQKYIGGTKFVGRIFETKLGKSEGDPQHSGVSAFDTRLVLADLLVATGRLDRARAEYGLLEQQQPNRPEVNQSLGFLALTAHDLPMARQYFEKAFAAGESDPQMCFQLAMLERDAKEPDDRIVPPLERAIRSKPDYTDALIQLGLMQVKERRFSAAIDTFMSVQNVTPEQATPLFASLAYSWIQTGDTDSARKNAETAMKWATTPAEKTGVAQLLELIEARAKGPFAPHPGEKLTRVEGTLRQVECTEGHTRLAIASGDKTVILELPNPKAVEFSHAGGGTLQLTCGGQKPLAMAVTYADGSALAQATAGVVRRIEY